jgi:O-antigen/teichoic acid export membrane protein
MVRRRTGDELDLLDASIQTASGALVSTTLFVLSGIVYAIVTSPSAVGTYFFVTISIALVFRPVRGLGQTLQKIGSEPGESIGPYLGLALLGGGAYLLVTGGVVALSAPTLARYTAFDAGVLGPAGLYAVGAVVGMVVPSLVAAVGYPSLETWLDSFQSGIQVVVLLALAGTLTTAGDLMVVVAAVRLAVLVPTAVVVGVVPRVPDRRASERAWDFAKWSVPDQVLDRFSYNMPVYVLGVVGTPAAVGIYETADRFADFGATISWRLSSPLLTKVSGDAAAGEDILPYLDGAITGGTGVTFLVFGYLLGAHTLLADIIFPTASEAFGATLLLVGGVNLVRGFWTLASHAIEGVGRPGLSARTKLYGLVLSVPVPVLFGAEYGAIAGAAGYAVMNIVICAYVGYYAHDVFGRVPVDRTLVVHLTAGMVAAVVVTSVVLAATEGGAVPAAGVAVLAAVGSLAGFSAVLVGLSAPTRVLLDRAITLSAQRVRSLV